MPYENFLVNAPKKIRSKRFRRNLLGEELMILGNPRRSGIRKTRRNIAIGFHDSRGAFHPIRKSEDYSRARAGEKKPKRQRPKISEALKGRKFKRKKFWTPKLLKEEKHLKLHKKGGVKEMAKKKKYKAVKRNEPKKYKKYKKHYKNEPKKYKKHVRRNAPKKYKKHSRRNAPAIATIGGVSITKPMTWLPHFVAAGAGAIVTGKAPVWVGAGDSPLWRYGSMALSAFGGGWIVSRFAGKSYGYAWMLGSGAIIMSDVISTYVLKQVGISGLADDLGNPEGYPYAEVGYYPYSGMTGYPYAEVGAYPYEYA